jgi:hypothetical protein
VIRASLYLGVSALIWFAEGFIFSRFLAFSVWQTGILALFYMALFGAALRALRNFTLKEASKPDGMAAWRVLSLAPMLTTILGSFVSLPVVLFVLALGKVG